ncbi:MAG: ATPase, T2SS/T4P/T4SS family [Pseudomonadota bacterium]
MNAQTITGSTPEKKVRKRLGDLLIDAGLIDEKTLQQALEEQKGKNKKIGQVLMEMGAVDDIEIARALSTQLGIPFVNLGPDKRVPKAVIALVPAELAENYLLIPLEEVKGELLIVMANPLEFYALDDLRFVTRKSIKIAIAPQSEILDAIERHYPKKGLQREFGGQEIIGSAIELVRPMDEEEKDIQKLLSIAELPPVIRFANTIFADAIKLNASDIHIEPQKASVIIRYRIDGIMREIMQTDKHVHASLVSRIKVLANMDISVRRRPQDGRSQVRFAEMNYDLRVSAIPTSYGEKLTIRILNPTSGNRSLEDLGLAPESMRDLENVLRRPQGMILVTGPTGSGKSSTLYAFLNRMNSPEVNIITVEDPIEFDIDRINQVQINPKAGITFAEGLRSILRQDPDIVMVGEIRDGETAEIACQAAQTGHMVLSSLHTNDAPSAVTRMMDLGVDSFVLTDTLTSIIGQRLVRKICLDCKVPDPPSPRLLKQLPMAMTADKMITFYKGTGCEVCRYTGYLGREGIFEMLMITPAIQAIIAPKVSALLLRQTAEREGFQSLIMDGIAKAVRGLTTIEEIFRVVPPDHQEMMPDPIAKISAAPGDVETKPITRHEVVPSISIVKPKKILVADDDEIVLKILANVLETENFIVITAPDGSEAIKKTFQEKPDLIVTDYLMPHMDGMALIKKLKSELSTRLIPIIIISALDEVESEVALIEAGADDYLAKPIETRRLVARINRLLNRSMS